MNIKKTTIVLATSILLVQSPVARSVGDTVVQLIANNIAAAADSIKQVASVEAMQAAIQKVIQDTTDSFMKQADTSSQKEIAAQGVIGDGLSQTAVDVFNQETVFWMTPDVGTCDRKTAKANIETASKQQEKLRADVSAAVAGRVRGSSGAGSHKITPVETHDANFCAQPDVDRKYCNSVSQYADYDLSAANFIQPRNNTYDPMEKKAAALFIVNTTAPTPLIQANVNHSGNAIEVKKFRATHNAYSARTNTASEALADVLAMNSAPNDTAGAKSLMELIKNQVEGRAMGEGGASFTTALTKGGPGTAARSAAEMESMTNLLLLKILESELRQQVLAAETHAMLSHQNMETQVLTREASIGVPETPKN